MLAYSHHVDLTNLGLWRLSLDRGVHILVQLQTLLLQSCQITTLLAFFDHTQQELNLVVYFVDQWSVKVLDFVRRLKHALLLLVLLMLEQSLVQLGPTWIARLTIVLNLHHLIVCL